jgi:hypothetical protein
MAGKIEYPTYEKYGVFKCLGCKHYCSNDYFDCEKNCSRTEQGAEQILCRQEDIRKAVKKINREKERLLQQFKELETYMEFTRCPYHTTAYSEDCPSSCAYKCKQPVTVAN